MGYITTLPLRRRFPGLGELTPLERWEADRSEYVKRACARIYSPIDKRRCERRAQAEFEALYPRPSDAIPPSSSFNNFTDVMTGSSPRTTVEPTAVTPRQSAVVATPATMEAPQVTFPTNEKPPANYTDPSLYPSNQNNTYATAPLVYMPYTSDQAGTNVKIDQSSEEIQQPAQPSLIAPLLISAALYLMG